MWYELILSPDDNGTWFVEAPKFPEVASFGDTQEDACRNGRNAIEEAIAARIASGHDIPHPDKDTSGKGRFVQMAAMIYLKSALYMIMREKEVSRADLMRKLGCQREHVDRLFRLDHNSRLDSMEAAFEAIGIPLRFDMEFPDAA